MVAKPKEPPTEPRNQKDEERIERRASLPEARKQPKPTAPRSRRLPPYKVLLHNDDRNEMAYVVITIHQLTPLKPAEAARKMFEAHHRGLALLLTTHRERAELYRDQFKAKGLTVTIEPA